MTVTSRHAALMDADGFWRQFVVAFYFDTPGDMLVGTLQKHWADGPRDDMVPHIRVQTDDGRSFEVTVSQERLKAELVKAAPAVGDRLRITYTGEAEKAAPGMNKAKLFTVEVRRTRSGSTSGSETNPSTHRYDPATGERIDPPTADPTADRGAAVDGPGPDQRTAPMTQLVDGPTPPASTAAAVVPGPGPDEPPNYVDPDGRVHVPDERPDITAVKARIEALAPLEKTAFLGWLDKAKLDTANPSAAKVRTINAELDRRAAQPSAAR